jgi:hypothetical protein
MAFRSRGQSFPPRAGSLDYWPAGPFTAISIPYHECTNSSSFSTTNRITLSLSGVPQSTSVSSASLFVTSGPTAGAKFFAVGIWGTDGTVLGSTGNVYASIAGVTSTWVAFPLTSAVQLPTTYYTGLVIGSVAWAGSLSTYTHDFNTPQIANLYKRGALGLASVGYLTNPTPNTVPNIDLSTITLSSTVPAIGLT